jgi:hypothetical protein
MGKNINELSNEQIISRTKTAKDYGFKPLNGQYPLVAPFSGGYEVRYDSDIYKIYPGRVLFDICMENFININHAAFAWNSIVKIFENNSFPKYDYSNPSNNNPVTYEI